MNDVKYVEKGLKTVNGNYRFVSHDQVTAKIHPYLVKHGITIIPCLHEMRQDGNRTEVLLNVSFVNADEPRDNLTVRYPGYGIDGGGFNKDGKPVPVGDKGPGKAISYAYKYALLKVFNLETGEDPDNDAHAAYEPEKCNNFEAILPDDMTEKDKKKLEKFLKFSSEALQKHIEDVKREAVKRPDAFLKKFNLWNPNEKAA